VSGYHPWFTHQIAINPFLSKEEHYRDLLLSPNSTPEDLEAFSRLLPTLPDPTPLEDILSEVHFNLLSFSNAMLGEVGIDRVARIPYNYDSSPRDLTPFHIPFDHQVHILEAQLALAVELGRNVSMHSVKSQQATFDLLYRMSQKYGDSWLAISIDMHSCGFSAQMWRSIEVYLHV
jgi:Tat protein secretion system quality control protein TatD with DNase activity